jgi:TPR repeat protein
VIQFSEYADWHGVAGWAAGLFPSVSRSPELDKLVATFRKEPSAEAQASAALQWVQDEIRYFSVSIGENSHRPMAPDAVLKRRFGDCKDKSYLLTSILNRLGIAAKPVLVNAQSRKLPGKVLPAPTWFDHAIVRLELDGKPYFVDPTRSSERGPISKRPAVLAGGAGLIVDAGSTSLESLPVERFELPSFDIAEKIAVASMDGAGVLASQYTYRAHAANWARQHYTGMSEREVRNELLATMEKQYPGASLQGKTKMVDNEAENTYVVTAEYRLPKPVSKHDGLYAIEYDSKILSSSLQVPGKLTRNFPLALTPSHQRYRLQIDWPADVRATGSSITQEVDNAHFNTHEEYTVLGNRTDLLIDHTVHSSEVAAAEVPDLQVAWKKVYPMMEASFRVPEGFVVDAEARTVPLRHVAAVRSAITNAERIRQSSAKFSGGNRGLKEFCEPTVDAVDLRRIAPSFDELLKEVTTGLEKHPMEPGVRRCLAMLDFAWGDFERALSYYEADGPLDDDDALVDQLAWARLLAGDVQGAIQANQRFVAARRKLGKLSTYDLASTLALYARAKIQAPAELRMLAGRFGDGPWPRPVLAYQLGTLKEADLLGMAGKQDPDQRDRMLSDAWFYIAQQRYAQGDGIGGVAALKWVSIHGIFGTPPLHQALGELWHADYGDKDYRNAQIALENGDKKKALELHQLAAARGHGGSLEALGHMYENGNGVSKDMARAIELYRSAAALGRTNAMNSLGVIYSEGNGVAADQVIAVDWLMKAAAVGDYYASRNIGWRHRRGIDAAWDGARARQFLTDSAELGNSEAQGELADVYLNGEDVPIDYMLAHYWARHAAESGDAHGKSILAYLYANGYGGVKANLPHAIALWQEAAKDRDTMAQFQLGLAYSKGRGVPMNLRKARELLAVAASNGNHYARLYLNNLIMTDDPSSSEAKRVITLFTKLAENGMTQAAEFLSEYYTKGIGVPKDAVAGAHWAQVATSKVKAPSTEQAAQGQP